MKVYVICDKKTGKPFREWKKLYIYVLKKSAEYQKRLLETERNDRLLVEVKRMELK